MTRQAPVSGLAAPIIALIGLYQRLLSPLLGRNCRFHPTCSEYAIEALRVHGLVAGSAYALWRILRCQPFCRGGEDPVPPRRNGLPAAERPHS